MLSNLPFYIPLLFIFTTVLTFIFFIAAVRKNNSAKTVIVVSLLITGWLAAHAILGLQKFYTVTNSIPPRFALMVAPAFLFIILLFLIKPGRRFIDSLPLKI